MMAVLVAPALSRKTGGYLLLALGIVLFIAGQLVRRQRKRLHDEALRKVEAILLFFAALCLALAEGRLEWCG